MLKVEGNMLATSLMEEISHLDLVTDAQAQALKGTPIRNLTSDTIAVELKDINDPFLVYGRRTKTILLHTPDVVVLLGKIDTVHGWALKAGTGEVAYLHGDWRLEEDFTRAMWTAANKGVIVHQCSSYLSGQDIPELAFVAADTPATPTESSTDGAFVVAEAAVDTPVAEVEATDAPVAGTEASIEAPAEPADVDDVSAAAEAELEDFVSDAPELPLTLEDLAANTPELPPMLDEHYAAMLRRKSSSRKKTPLGLDIDW